MPPNHGLFVNRALPPSLRLLRGGQCVDRSMNDGLAGGGGGGGGGGGDGVEKFDRESGLRRREDEM